MVEVFVKLVKKAEPDVIAPTGLVGFIGEKLSTIDLPEGWSWTDGDAVIKSDVTSYKVKYISQKDITKKSKLMEVLFFIIILSLLLYIYLLILIKLRMKNSC